MVSEYISGIQPQFFSQSRNLVQFLKIKEEAKMASSSLNRIPLC